MLLVTGDDPPFMKGLDAAPGRRGLARRLVDVAPSPLARLPNFLERVGAKPRTAGGLRSRIGRLFGQPTARLSGATVIIDELAPKAARPP